MHLVSFITVRIKSSTLSLFHSSAASRSNDVRKICVCCETKPLLSASFLLLNVHKTRYGYKKGRLCRGKLNVLLLCIVFGDEEKFLTSETWLARVRFYRYSKPLSGREYLNLRMWCAIKKKKNTFRRKRPEPFKKDCNPVFFCLIRKCCYRGTHSWNSLLLANIKSFIFT